MRTAPRALLSRPRCFKPIPPTSVASAAAVTAAATCATPTTLLCVATDSPRVMLYGASPDYPEHDASHWQLQPAMTLRSRLIGVRNTQAGDTIGYGSRYTAKKPMRIGVVACGYADGYPRHTPTAPRCW